MGLPSVVKNLPANAGDTGLVPGNIPLEKEMATHSSILAWEIPWTEEPDGLQSMGSQELDTATKQQKASSYCVLGTVFYIYAVIF